jgi:hypothetical protein
MKIKSIILLLLILPSVCLAEYPSIDFYTDGVIQDSNAYSGVSVFDNATVDMIGGFIQWRLLLYDTSTFNAYGGEVGGVGGLPDIIVLEYSTLNLHYLQLSEYHRIWTEGDFARINVYGYNFEYVPYYSDWWLYGNWANNEAFCLQFRGPWTRDYVVLHEIPEPATLLLIGLGGLLLRKW